MRTLAFCLAALTRRWSRIWSRILDLLADIWPADALNQLQAERKLQIVPLGFMRGRTFNNAFIVADEMQNCSVAQMRTLLTRLGDDSRMAITGDLNQVDADKSTNGLGYLVHKLRAAQQLHGEASTAEAGGNEGEKAVRDDVHAEPTAARAGASASELHSLRDAVRRDFELVVLDNASMQRNPAVQTVLRLLA